MNTDKAREESAFQDFYTDDVSHCYGCGRLNEDGLHVRSFWDGDESVAHFTPKPQHTAIPGFVYGGLIASLFDCHSTGTAFADHFRREERQLSMDPAARFVTASLKVDFLRPTPIDAELELRAQVTGYQGRKVIVEGTLRARGEICARGRAVLAPMPGHWAGK